MRSRLLVAVALVVCGFLAFREVGQVLESRNRLGLNGVTLHAEVTELQAGGVGRLLQVDVTNQASVEQGQTLAVLETEERLAGWTQLRRTSLVAPHAGRVLYQPRPSGSVVSADDTIVALYVPNELVFRAPVSFGLLTKAKIGMRAVLEFPTLGEVEATLEAIEPRFDLDPLTAPDDERAFLILRPTDPTQVADVIPGLTLSGWLEIGTADDDAPSGVESGGYVG